MVGVVGVVALFKENANEVRSSSLSFLGEASLDEILEE